MKQRNNKTFGNIATTYQRRLMGRRRASSSGRTPAAINATFVPHQSNLSRGQLLLWGPERPERFPWQTALERLGLPMQDIALYPLTARLLIPRDGQFKITQVTGVALSPAATVRCLGTAGFDTSSKKGRRRYQATSSLLAWSMAAKLALELIARQAFVPAFRKGPGQGLVATWLAAVESSHDVGRVQRLSSDMPPSAHALLLPNGRRHWDRRRQGRRRRRPPRIWHPERLLRSFLDAAIDDFVRRSMSGQSPWGDDLDIDPEDWEGAWIEALVSPPNEAHLDFGEHNRGLHDDIQHWLSWAIESNHPSKKVDVKIGLWLEMPDEQSGDADFWYLTYTLIAADDASFTIPAKQVFATSSSILRIYDHTFERPQEKLLEALGQAGQLFEPIRASLDHPRPEGVFLDARQAWRFISEVGPVLFGMGFDVRLPEELTGQGQRRLRARLRIRDVCPSDIEYSDSSHVGLSNLAAFEWEAALGDEVIDAQAFQQIVDLKQPLIRWRGQWVLVDPVQLKGIEDLLLQTRSSGTMTRFEALSRALSGSADPNSPDLDVEVVIEGKIAALVESLTKGEEQHQDIGTPDHFVGTLRPYQGRGLSWLAYQANLGLGACLADDMGLGKTIQVIAFLLRQQLINPKDGRGTLLICPTSVVGNWQRELNRFGPTLRVIRHHGSDRCSNEKELTDALAYPHSILLTTYGLISRDIHFLKKRKWAHFILDEAQAIKNIASKRSQIVREIDAEFRVALTGTPIENRLSELWSILDFLNPGLLGTHERFRRLYELPIERYQDPAALERLRGLVGPFLLRRLKTDPTIIQDLPEKQEMKVFCTLTGEQATLYQALIDDAMGKIDEARGIARHGRVLALLTHLKQVCNHPTLFLKNQESEVHRSGKFTRLMEMLEEIIESGDRALIFTQFKTMGDLLVKHIQDQFDVEVPFLHGGVPQLRRDKLVDSFQDEEGPPVFVLSLKAGGTGLNLTAANHVFHFDRWWNPAVEDQATDRAFRIGQTRNVQVHKLVTLGTLEEKIDTMLTEKRNLAETIVDNTGAWLTVLDTSALRELVSLSSDAALDDAD